MASRVAASVNGRRGKTVPVVHLTLEPVQGTGSKWRRAITVGMGCGIPCLSLALSSIGGRLCIEGHPYLGGCVLVLCCSVLAVSLSHLAWAIGDITRSRPWQSWCLAAAIDVALVLGELACIAGAGWWLVSTVMGCVTVVSAVLNCWAFLRG